MRIAARQATVIAQVEERGEQKLEQKVRNRFPRLEVYSSLLLRGYKFDGGN
jgi:hypothetical protein